MREMPAGMAVLRDLITACMKTRGHVFVYWLRRVACNNPNNNIAPSPPGVPTFFVASSPCPIRKVMCYYHKYNLVYGLRQLHESPATFSGFSSPSPGYAGVPRIHRASHVGEPRPHLFQSAVQRTPASPRDDRTI